MLFFRKPGFGLAQIRHQILTLHALDHAREQLAHPARILGKDVVPLGFADLLQDHLLGGLRRNPSQRLSRFGETDFRIDLRLGEDCARVFERNFFFGVGHLGHRLFHAVDADRTGGLIEVRHQVLISVEMLARRHQHGILDGIQNDLWIDPFFLAEYFDGLKNRS